MNKSVRFSVDSYENYISPVQEVDQVGKVTENIPILSVNAPKLYTYEELKNDEEIKKEIIKNELKIIQSKMDECNSFLRQIYISVFVLLSKNYSGEIHLHGIYSNLDKGTEAFNKITNYDKKISNLILYKTFVDNLSAEYDIKLFDDLNQDKIYEKKYN
jgi:hypothetical protein